MTVIPNIMLRQGRNLWRLLRTDRDGASEAEVAETTGPAVSKMIRPAGVQSGPWEVFRTDDGSATPSWRIGEARPVTLVAIERYSPEVTPPSLHPPPGAMMIAQRLRYPGDGLPTVAGQRPWWVVVDLWWRGLDVAIPWPGFAVNWLGVRTQTVIDADWVLDEAIWVPPAEEVTPDPGDETALSEHLGHAEQAAKNALRVTMPPLIVTGGIVIGIYLLVSTGAISKLWKGKS